MDFRKSLILLTSCLGLLHGTLARGAIPPRGAQGLAPSAPGGELLNLDWHVYVAAKPIYCILVEKDRQRLRILRHDGRPRVVAEYDVSTGENPGSKEIEGDAKTPEGIYLITKGYLDRQISIFGMRAYQLNYPNWFDLKVGRTGYGIFLHGTNRPLRPTNSNGCVTLRNDDMDKVAGYLTIGTPVFIVGTLGMPTEGEDDTSYPDLTGDAFAGAKALLLPHDKSGVDFASLYLIRIHGQTLVAGEYWGAPEQSAPRLAVAYLQQDTDQQWAVVDRGPATGLEEPGELEMIAGIPPQVQRQELGLTDKSGGTGDAPWLWQPASETIALEWFREANSLNTPMPALASQDHGGITDKIVYVLFAMTTCLSIASAFILTRRREDGNQGPIGGEGGESILRVQDEVGEAMELLRTMQARIDKETKAMESHQALQERVKGLEEAFAEKQTAIAALRSQQASSAGQGVSEHSGQSEGLGRLRGELSAMQEAMAAARVEMAEAAKQAARVNEQLAEVKRLATEREETTMNGDDLKGVVTATCDQLLEKIQAKLESLPRLDATPGQGETSPYQEVLTEIKACAVEMRAVQQQMTQSQTERQELAGRLARVDALEATVVERERKIKSLELVGAQATSRALLEREKLEAQLKSLAEELHQEQEAKAELALRLSRISELEGAVAEWDREGRPPLAVSEEVQMRMAEERSTYEATLQALQAELQQERSQKATLSARLATLGKVQQTLAVRDQELAALRAAAEEAKGLPLQERDEMEAKIAALDEELKKEQAAHQALSVRVAETDQELTALRTAAEEAKALAAKEKAEMTASLAALDGELKKEQAAHQALSVRVAETDQELTSLRTAAEEAKALAAKEKAEMAASLASLDRELKKEQTAHQALAAKLAALNTVQQTLSERDQELAALRAAAEEAKGLAVKEKAELASKVEALDGELQKEQTAKKALSVRLAALNTIQQTLSERDQELAAHRAAQEEAKVLTAQEKAELESKVAALDEGLKKEQAAHQTLAAHLAGLNKVQQTLSEREQELAALRAAQEEAKGLAAQEKAKMESTVAALDEGLKKEQAAHQTLAARLAGLNKVQQTLSEREQELAALRAAQEEAKGLAAQEKAKMESTVAALDEELKKEQAAHKTLAARLTELNTIQQTLSEREQELAALRAAQEEAKGLAAQEKAELQSTVATLDEGLKKEQAARQALALRLTGLNKVQQTLNEREQELVSLREEKERDADNAATDKKRLEANLAEIVLARQVEVTNISKGLQQAKEKAAAAEERVAALQQELGTVSEALRRKTELEQAAQQHPSDHAQVVAALRQEIAAFKAKVAALEEKGLNDGVVLIKGSHYLPGDVLRKWIGKESGK